MGGRRAGAGGHAAGGVALDARVSLRRRAGGRRPAVDEGRRGDGGVDARQHVLLREAAAAAGRAGRMEGREGWERRGGEESGEGGEGRRGEGKGGEGKGGEMGWGGER